MKKILALLALIVTMACQSSAQSNRFIDVPVLDQNNFTVFNGVSMSSFPTGGFSNVYVINVPYGLSGLGLQLSTNGGASDSLLTTITCSPSSSTPDNLMLGFPQLLVGSEVSATIIYSQGTQTLSTSAAGPKIFQLNVSGCSKVAIPLGYSSGTLTDQVTLTGAFWQPAAPTMGGIPAVLTFGLSAGGNLVPTPSGGVNCNGAAVGSPPSGNPCEVAGQDGTNVRTIATDLSGRVAVSSQTPAGDGQSNGATGAFVGGLGGVAGNLTSGVVVATMSFNGITWDRAFYCSKPAIVSALGATTTQIVAAVAAQKIRVCHVYISNNSATAMTVTFVEGTGANCVTGQTALTGKILLNANTLAGDDIDIPLGNGSPWETVTASDALCVTGVGAGASDVTITYAQY